MKKNLTAYSGIAILFVVLMHANAYYLHHINLNSTNLLMNIFIDMIYIAVPMFIFIAGYKYELTKKDRNLKKYYKSKINNIIRPTLIISLLWIGGFLLLSIIQNMIEELPIDIMFYIKILFYRTGEIIIGNNDIYQCI